MTELNIKNEIGQIKKMSEACLALTNIDFNYFKKQFESNEIKKKKLQEKEVMIFDMSNDNKSSGPNQNYFGQHNFLLKILIFHAIRKCYFILMMNLNNL